MTPSAFRVPPMMSGVSQMFCGGPPWASTFFSLPPEKNAIHLLSGDQNNPPAPSVPASFCGTSTLIGRTNRAVDPPSFAE